MSDAVEFRHLKYIVAVAETSSFTRAAERLFVSQPSLSKQIKEIEEEIGFHIFTRTPDGVFPTPVGQVIVDYATATLYGRKYVFRMAKDIFLGNIPPLRVGFSSFVAPRHLHTFRVGYMSQFPSCLLRLSGGVTAHVLQKLERGELDCAMVPLPVVGSQWHVTHLASSPLVACMRIDDPLANQSIVTLSELEGRLSIFRDPEGHPWAHSRLVEMFTEVGIAPQISCSATTPQDIQLLVRDGFGVALVPEDSLLEKDVTTRHIAGVSWTADTAFVYHGSATHASLQFIERYILGDLNKSPKKIAQSERPQLPLRFDELA